MFENKQEAIDAICGRPFSYGTAEVLVKYGYMKFTGNQHNENWEWERSKLKEQSLDRLNRLYAAAKRGWLVMSDILPE